MSARDAAVANVARKLSDPTGRCPACGRLLRLVRGGTMLPRHLAPARRSCPRSETPAVDR
jgi:hypothetical protein